MTQFTIEHLTRKDNAAPGVKSPTSNQRRSLLNAMNILQQSGQPLPIPWGSSGTDSEGRSAPSSSESDVSPSSSPPEKPSSTLSPTSTSSPNVLEQSKEESPTEEEPQKPPHSYIALIAMAILNSSTKRLLLCDIYEYIMENYPYFRNNERSWRNSIRHNLSLNECFIKAGRSDDGRGHFWAIHPANAEDFARGDFRRRRARRRVRSDYDIFSYPGYPYYPAIPASLPGHYGYVPMTYSPMTSIFPTGITPYMPPRLPPLPSAVPAGYVPAVSSAVPSVSSPGSTSTSVPTACTSACTSSTSRQSPIAGTSPSCSPPTSHAVPLFTPPLVKRPSTLMTPYAHQPWTPYSRSFHPYMQ